MQLTLIKPAVCSLFSLEQVKTHLRIDHSDEDDYLISLIKTATQMVEDYTGRSLLTKTWSLIETHGTSREGICEIPLSHPPFLEVLELNQLIDGSKRAYKRFAIDASGQVPVLQCAALQGGVEVIYRSGYGDTPLDVPEPLKHAVLLLVGDLYENRSLQAVSPQTLLPIVLGSYRVMGAH